jgi:hypothetical protein
VQDVYNGTCGIRIDSANLGRRGEIFGQVLKRTIVGQVPDVKL